MINEDYIESIIEFYYNKRYNSNWKISKILRCYELETNPKEKIYTCFSQKTWSYKQFGIFLDTEIVVEYIYSDNYKLFYNFNDFYIESQNDNPAIIVFKKNKIILEEWYKKGKLHRENNPAIINKKKKETSWYLNGKEKTEQEVIEKYILKKLNNF